MIQTLKIHENSLKMFHNNACFLNKNFEHIEYLLKSTNINYNIIARSETRIIKNSEITKNIILKNYNFQYAPTESTADGTMLYIANQLAYRPRSDLKIYKTNELESTFIELINPKKHNVLIGCIYRHQYMNQEEFNKYYLNNLLENSFSSW